MVLVRDRYVFIGRLGGSTGLVDAGVVIDERTGVRTSVSRPGCGALAIGGPWLMFDCGSDVAPRPQLYGLAHGAWKTVTPDPTFDQWCAPPQELDPNCSVHPTAVGAAWIEFGESCYHCGESYMLQNIETGKLARDPTGGNVTADLNSPALARRVCAPLRVPRSWEPGLDAVPIPGSLAFYGRFALASSNSPSLVPSVYLEQCGSRLHELICRGQACSPTANAHVVLWQATREQLNALFLPSRRRVRISLPVSLGSVYSIALSSHTLYVLNESNELYMAHAPMAP